MDRFATVLRIVFRRSMGNRRLLATVVVGVVLSAALMASVALYSDAIRDLGLKHQLAEQPPRSLDIEIVSSNHAAEPGLYNDRRDITDDLLDRDAGAIVDEVVRYGRTDTFFLTAPGDQVDREDQQRPRANFQFYEDLLDHVEIVAGAPPAVAEPAPPGEAPAAEVLIGQAGAQQLGVETGDTFDLHPFWDEEAAPVRITVTGVVAPTDPDDPFWFGAGHEGRFAVTTTSWPTYMFFVPEETITGALAGYLPNVRGTFSTYGLVDLGAINSRNADEVESRLLALQNDLRSRIERTSVSTGLPDTIAAYQEKLFFTRLPLFALMVQIVGIVLYYLVMVSNMLVERQTGEIALLKSRGASTGQVMGIYAIEGIALCIIGVILGPLLAGAAISLLGTTPAFSDLSGGATLEVNFSTWAFLLALLGVLLALVALLVPAYRATRHSIIHYKQNLARPPQQPAFLRYYLDLALIGVAAFAFYQLRQRGSLVTDRLFGDLSADPLLLVTPTLFMLMIALVFLRIFPLVLRLASWAGRGLNGATIPLGLFHLVRSPLHYSRLILLLLLATAVGMFAAGFRATLERSYDDRAAYEAGAPARIRYSSADMPPDLFASSVASRAGTDDVTPVARLSANYSDLQTFNFVSSQFLGVMPETFGDAAFWRGDFAGDSLDDLLARLVPAEEEPVPTVGAIPPDYRYFGLWAQLPGGLEDAGASIGLRLTDPSGSLWEYYLAPAGIPDDAGWQLYAVDLESPESGPGDAPDRAEGLQLDAVFLRIPDYPPGPDRLVAYVDDLQVADALPAENAIGFPDPVGVDTFESVEGYVTIAGISAVREPAAFSQSENGRGDQSAVQLDFAIGAQGLHVFGFRPAAGAEVLPVLASEGFLDEVGVEVGDDLFVFLNRQYVPISVVGSFEYFPTWDPNGREELLVGNLDTLQGIAARVPVLASGAYPNEAWIGDPLAAAAFDPSDTGDLRIGSGLPPTLIIEALLREEAASDPLIAASWEGILFLSFAAVLLLTALGFIVYSFLTAQSRSLEFAILRTMGFSTRQIFGLVSFEQVFVIAAGAIVGTFLGMPLSGLMIDFMGVTERGEEVLPPIVTRISWGTVLTVYSLLAVVFIATIVALAILYSRLSVHRALRMGEL